jgi:hypothetical protein
MCRRFPGAEPFSDQGASYVKALDFIRCALTCCVALAMLAGCGGHASEGIMPANGAPDHLPGQRTFYYTGAAQSFTVPARVRQVTVVARGAKGAGNPIADGGRVHAVIAVTPGERLAVYVGGDASGATGGFNGGSDGGSSALSGQNGYGGGGASDVREGGDALSDRIVVAGAAGGEGGLADGYGCPTPTGGKGGGLTGGSGTGGPVSYAQCGQGAGGGTQSAGGSGGDGGTRCFGSYGNAGDNGALGIGGSGGSGSPSGYTYVAGGGGGGGGYYGGGGGGAGCSSYSSYISDGGGGGGGSSYVEPSATDVHLRQGWKKPERNGLVVFSW